MNKLTPCLWFDGNAEEAVNFYAKVFKDSKIKIISRYGDSGPMPKGTVLTIVFEINGMEMLALNGGPNYKFTPAVSFMIDCKTQEEVDYYWDSLLTGGGREEMCGWLTDRFGLSWQVVPEPLIKMIMDKDPVKAGRATQAMFKMRKIIIQEIQDAFDGK